MKIIKNWLLTGMVFFMVSMAFSQGKITGTITDGQSSLPGANVIIKGTSKGTAVDLDGKFTLSTTINTGEIVISFLGFNTKTVKFSVSKGETQDLGDIVLVSNSNELQEIVVKSSVIDVAKDRKTPVAVSTIKAAEIQEKLGTQEFPEINVVGNKAPSYLTPITGHDNKFYNTKTKKSINFPAFSHRSCPLLFAKSCSFESEKNCPSANNASPLAVHHRKSTIHHTMPQYTAHL